MFVILRLKVQYFKCPIDYYVICKIVQTYGTYGYPRCETTQYFYIDLNVLLPICAVKIGAMFQEFVDSGGAKFHVF